MSEPDPSRLRISDAERHRVAEVLRQAAGDGRIDLAELDERLEATYAARTYADLVPITADLGTVPAVPQPGLPAAHVPVQSSSHERALAIMSGVERRGPWLVPEHFSVFCMMGGADIDLRQARFAAPEVELTVSAFMGGATIIVNETTHVIVTGTGIMGGYSPPKSGPTRVGADSQVVRIGGFAIMGGVDVVRKPMPGEDTTPGWRRRD